MSISSAFAFMWMTQDTDGKSTLVQVMTGAVRQQAIIWGNADLDLMECARKSEKYLGKNAKNINIKQETRAISRHSGG